jgi:hypothetical protein
MSRTRNSIEIFFCDFMIFIHLFINHLQNIFDFFEKKCKYVKIKFAFLETKLVSLFSLSYSIFTPQ